MTVIVLTVDQRGSRSTPDLVADAVDAMADLPLLLPFERTAGDEFQGVLDDPAALPRAVERLLREGAWYIGLGIGDVDEPAPRQRPRRQRPGVRPRPARRDRRQEQPVEPPGLR